MNPLISFLVGVLLRVGIPILISALVFLLLKRLDDHWQKQASDLPVSKVQPRCWEIHRCSEEKRKTCAVSSHPNIPCWQLFRTTNGLRDECLGCEVFLTAPIPTVS